MKKVFKVAYDVKVKGRWLSGSSNRHAWDSVNIAHSGDAIAAAIAVRTKVKKQVFKDEYGKECEASDVKIISVEPIAHDVI